jgi:hypothetical protein
MNLRQAGGTMGPIPYQQQQSFERLLGELDPDGDPQVLAENLQRVHNMFWEMVDPSGAVRPEPFALPFDESGFQIQPGGMTPASPQDPAAPAAAGPAAAATEYTGPAPALIAQMTAAEIRDLFGQSDPSSLPQEVRDAMAARLDEIIKAQ